MLVMLLAVFLFCVTRGWKIAFIPLGLLFAGKQYMAIFIPLLWLLPLEDGRPRPHWRLLWRALAFGAAVTLPFFVINPKAFFECMVLLQLRQPFRIESLSLNAWWFIHHDQRLPDWLGFASVIPTTALALWRCDRSATGFAAGLAFVSFMFFALSKQAFGNYYFFTMGVICCALAYAGHERSRQAA
jgi:4-amino-4-deoxy-L-arabinose transferase-like glycosyltransferase